MEGYHKLANFMGRYDDCAIFKRFYELNMQNLLYYQAEIMSLEHDFHELAGRDMKEQERKFHHKHWESLSRSSENHEDMEQWDKWLEIRAKLKEYNDALLQVTALSKLKQPDPHNLSFLQDWLERPSWGNFPLRGIEAKAWKHEEGDRDLVAVSQQEESDPLTKWFMRTIIPFYHNSVSKTPKGSNTGEPPSEFTHYPSERFHSLLNIIRTIIATLLPIISIITLYFVSDMLVRLGLVVGFTIIFSMILMLVTQGKRVEVFAATSAFAAIQVVFISGNGGFVS